jgi:hypothetical protein
MTPAHDIKLQLDELNEERLSARDAGLRPGSRYMSDLDEEIAAARASYIGTAVTEIAILRAELGDRLQG